MTPRDDESDAWRPGRTFAPGERIAGRYRVVSFIARGGMGEVYEVEDGELQTRVALKTIRAELADDEAVLERFKSEISLARRVTHTNVCRLFDLGFHDGPRGRILFLTMELLEGETLKQRLRRAGRLSLGEARPVVEQLVAGLAAAHGYGIVHRDFKSDNVMLVASPDGTAPARAVITDFGLARSAESPTAPTGSDELKGTPAYMAPEQLANGPIGRAVDIYALGVVLYEMVTGTLPFVGDTPLLAAIKRLTTDPTPPRQVAPELDPRWEEVILRCLERDPARRWQQVGEVTARLADAAPPSRRQTWTSTWTWTWTWRSGLAALLALVAIGGGAAVWRARRQGAAQTATARRSFAALGLRNLSGRAESAWLDTALTELLAAEVETDGDLRRVPDESVARLRRDLKLPPGALPSDALGRAAASLHADLVLSGSYLAGGGHLRLDVVVQDTHTGDNVALASESGDEAALLDLVARAGERLRHRLGLRGLSPSDVAEARASLPADTTAARLYAEGLAALRRFDALAARDRLGQATAAAPDFPLAHAALAEAWRLLGHHADEEREAMAAWEHARSLPRADQLLVEANLHIAKKEWPRAVELYRALYDFYPGSLDYGLRLAEVQNDAGQAKDARATLAQLRREIPPAAARDPRLELAEARACEIVSDFRCEDAAAHLAADKARALGADELVGEARMAESTAALTIGDRARAAQAANAAYELFRRVDNPFLVGQALRARGAVAWKAGELATAHAQFLEAARLFEKLGDGDHRGRALNSLAGIESDLNHHAEALALYRQALLLAERAANRQGIASVHLNLGQQLHWARQYDESERELQAGIALARELGQRRLEAIGYESLGILYYDRGELGRAHDTEQQAIAVATAIRDVTTMAQARIKLAQALHATGQTKPAEEAFRQAIAVLAELGESWRVGNGKVRLARLYADVGRLDEAEAMARSAVELHRRAGVDSGESAAELAHVLLAAGKLDAARVAATEARAHGESGADMQAILAELEIADGHADAAVTRLGHALALPALTVPERLESSLLLGQAELAAGQAAKGRARLRALAGEARAKSFVMLARRAAAAAAAAAPR